MTNFSILIYNNYLLEMTSPQVPTALPVTSPRLHNKYSESSSKPSWPTVSSHPTHQQEKKFVLAAVEQRLVSKKRIYKKVEKIKYGIRLETGLTRVSEHESTICERIE